MGRRLEFNTGIPYQIHILSNIHTCGTGIQDILNSKNEISTRTLYRYKSFSPEKQANKCCSQQQELLRCRIPSRGEVEREGWQVWFNKRYNSEGRKVSHF